MNNKEKIKKELEEFGKKFVIKNNRLQMTLSIIQDGGKFLVGDLKFKEGKNIGELSGFQNFPGGKQDIGESIEETSIREVFEETGIKIVKQENIGTLRYIWEDRYPVEITVFLVKKFNGTPKNSREMNIKWIKLQDLGNIKLKVNEKSWLIEFINNFKNNIYKSKKSLDYYYFGKVSEGVKYYFKDGKDLTFSKDQYQTIKEIQFYRKVNNKDIIQVTFEGKDFNNISFENNLFIKIDDEVVLKAILSDILNDKTFYSNWKIKFLKSININKGDIKDIDIVLKNENYNLKSNGEVIFIT